MLLVLPCWASEELRLRLIHSLQMIHYSFQYLNLIPSFYSPSNINALRHMPSFNFLAFLQSSSGIRNSILNYFLLRPFHELFTKKNVSSLKIILKQPNLSIYLFGLCSYLSASLIPSLLLLVKNRLIPHCHLRLNSPRIQKKSSQHREQQPQ